MVRIALTGATRKILIRRLQQAYANHWTRLIRRNLRLERDRQPVLPPAPRPFGQAHRQSATGIARSAPGWSTSLGLPTACWTTALIADLIHLRFKVDDAPRYLSHLLDTLGFSYQKAKFPTDHLNDEEALLWLEETWPQVLRLAREKQAGGPSGPLFGDEASFAQWGSLGYTRALKGVQPIVKTTGIRKAYRVFGLLNCLNGTLYFQSIDGKFNTESYRASLEGALAQFTGHLILIQDNVPCDVSCPLRVFYAAHFDRLTVYQLSAYSPALNPIEKLWKKAKKDASHLRYFPLFADLIAEVAKTLTRFAGLRDELTSLQGEYEFIKLPIFGAHAANLLDSGWLLTAGCLSPVTEEAKSKHLANASSEICPRARLPRLSTAPTTPSCGSCNASKQEAWLPFRGRKDLARSRK